jgi:hypothetical protein
VALLASFDGGPTGAGIFLRAGVAIRAGAAQRRVLLVAEGGFVLRARQSG